METEAPADTAAIRAELEETRTAFHTLVAQIGDAQWKLKSGNPAWTCGQLAWHVAEGVRFIAGQIESVKKGKSTNPPSFVMPALYKLSELNVRMSSRKATRDSVLADFDSGINRLREILDATGADQFAMVATNFGATRNVAEMFHVPTSHFMEHQGDIKQALGIS